MTIKSTIVGNEAFLQGQYLSIGLNADGTIGTTKAAPTGFYTDKATGLLRAGFVADLDGFGTGKAALDDVIQQGRAIEGFNIGYKIGGKTVVQSNQMLTGFSEIDGVNSSTGTGQIAWNGLTAEKLKVAQKVTLTDDAKYIRIDVTLTNTSSVAMSDVRYMRTADPDQDANFATANKIVRQGDDGALVSSGLNKTSNAFFLFSEDDRAVVSTYGFVNDDPYAAAAFSNAQAQGFTRTADETVNITFGLGTLGAGASTTITLYMGVTDDLAATIKRIEAASDDSDDDDDGDDDGDVAPAPVDLAPVVANDSLTLKENGSGNGNVLKNDRDPEGDALTASLKSGPTNGTVKLAADGSFTYTAKAGFSGSDSFIYAASDGVNSTNGTVNLTVEAAPPPVIPPVVTPGPVLDILSRAGLVDGSAAANQVLTGASFVANTFFFDVDASSGRDTITNFGRNDVLAVDRKLYDGNKDGIIGLSNSVLSIDAPKVGDTVKIDGVSALRFLGTDDHGLSIYADASVRPRGAKESTVADDRFAGDSLDRKKNVFFFDSALGIDLGADQIANFGKRDMIVTTGKLDDDNGDGLISLAGGSLSLDDGTGSVALKGMGGAAVDTIEYDGSVVRDGTTYYVYSLVGSAVDAGDLGF